jgi:hypothetical protein
MSEARCAESVKIAIEFARMPPPIYKMTKRKETDVAVISLFMATLFDS